MNNDEWVETKDVFIVKSKELPTPTRSVLLYSCIEPNDVINGLTEQEWLRRYNEKKKKFKHN